MKNITTAGGLIIKNRTILLILHKKGKLVIPKGHVEKGESHSQAAVREVKEETGVEAEISGYIGEIIRPSTERNGEQVTKTIKIYLMNTTDTYLESNDEHPVWVSIDEALENMRYEQEADFIKNFTMNKEL